MNSGHYVCDACGQPCFSSDCPVCDRPGTWVPDDATPRRRPDQVAAVPSVPPSPSRSSARELNAALEELAPPPAAPRIPAAEWFRRIHAAVDAAGKDSNIL